MATIFEQALKELDEVKRGLSTSNAVLFKGTIQAAEKAEDSLKAFLSASATASGHLDEMLKVQSILTGKSAAKASSGKTRTGFKWCLFPKCDNQALNGPAGNFCAEHKDTKQAAEIKKMTPAEKLKLKGAVEARHTA